MRVVVIGSSGTGKSTLAARLGARCGMQVVELDALNWKPGWVALSQADPPAFLRDVAAATEGPHWVIAGNYGVARHIVWTRATHLVWLDYPKHVVMARVIRRSFLRALRHEEIWGGNRESFLRWADPTHPIRWAWSQWDTTRANAAARLAEPLAAHLHVTRLTRPQDAAGVVEALARYDR